MKLALKTSTSPNKISFTGPAKTMAQIQLAVEEGVIINIESFREIEDLGKIAATTGRTPNVSIRVNPNFELKGSGMKMGGGPKQFGIDSELVPAALHKISHFGFTFRGFHIYSGSQNLHYEAIIDAQNKSFDLAYSLSKEFNQPFDFINLGGGFGIPYFTNDLPLQIQPIADNLFSLVEKSKKLIPETHLIIELGRYLVGESGIYVCQIVDKKVSRGTTYLITNGGLNHHLAATGNLGQIIRRHYPIAIANKLNSSELETVSIVGPLCTPLDSFADNIKLPKAEIGDYIVLFQSGAYGATASPQQFLHQTPVMELFG